MPTYYKVLNTDGTACHGGTGQWSLPQDGQPGEWMPHIEDIRPCYRGYHIVTLEQSPYWLKTLAVWTIEPKGQIIHDTDKAVCQSARLLQRVNQWNPRTIRLLAALWVEHLIEDGYYDCLTRTEQQKLTVLIDVTRGYAENDGTTLTQVETARHAVRSSSSSSSSLSSLSSLLSSSLLSSSLLSSSASLWLRARYEEFITAPGDWSRVSWEEW